MNAYLCACGILLVGRDIVEFNYLYLVVYTMRHPPCHITLKCYMLTEGKGYASYYSFSI